RPGFRLASIDTGHELVLHGEDRSTLTADAVVLGLGASLNTALAAPAHLTREGDSVVVDSQLRTSAADVYAAGDIIWFEDPLLGRRRVEHVDHAQTSGDLAGRNMAGAGEDYTATPLFLSDLFDDGYEAGGEPDTRPGAHGVGNQGRPAAVNHFLKGGAGRGGLLWNTLDSVPAARQLIADSAGGAL